MMSDHIEAMPDGSESTEDLDRLCQALIGFAQQMLARHGEFHPFGAAIGTDGDVRMIASHHESELPSPHEVIEHLTAAHRRQAAYGAIRAAGICVDIQTVPPGQTRKTDAICVGLEHKNGEATDVVLPYRRNWLRRIQFGEPFAFGREPTFFVNDNAPQPPTSN